MITRAQSSCVDDYRSIIDDLTLEIQQLKKELKRYKQLGPAKLLKDKLFEIKVHGLSQQKKRELEAVLIDVATDLDGSSDVSSSQKRIKTFPCCYDHTYLESGLQHKYNPSSPGSNLQPADSAYARVSIGAESSSMPLNRPILTSTKSSKGKVEDHLRDVPDGLYPQNLILTDKERKSLVVRRLEELFIGRSKGAHISKMPPMRPGGSFIMAQAVSDAHVTDTSPAYEPPTHGTESIREAKILSLDQRSRPWGHQYHSSENGLALDPDKDSSETGGNDKILASDSKLLHLIPPLPKQRPTRPCDLDPGRAQAPSEIKNYIQHLDLLPCELFSEQRYIHDVHLDTMGWISLNLLYSLAQLHLVYVTPDFIRSAISETSTAFELSPDGHQVRWQDGYKDTKFSSHSSSYISQASLSIGNTHSSEKKRKRQKTSRFTSDKSQSVDSDRDKHKFDQQLCERVGRFRYKPLFAQQDLSDGCTSRGAPVCPFTVIDDENLGKPGLRLKYSAEPTDKWQCHQGQGSITYYSGAPFCIDLTGDPTDPLPTTQEQSQQLSDFIRSPPQTTSGSLISYRPLTGRCEGLRQQTSAIGEDNNEVQGLRNDGSEQGSDIELDLIWNNDQQYVRQQPLEPCGLGGIRPDDHFVVLVHTKRPKQDLLSWSSEPQIGRLNASIEKIIRDRAVMITSSPLLGGSEAKPVQESRPIEIEYLTWRTERLMAVQLPSPAIFFPPFSTDGSTSSRDNDLFIDRENGMSLEEHMSWTANRHDSNSYPNGVDFSSGVDGSEIPDESF
jgi:hypothetical protein